jgi:hypothetical protein
VLHYVLVFNNQLWVIGGQEVPEGLVPPPNPYPTEPVLYDDVWTSSDGMNWSKVGSIPHALGMICGEVVFDNQMWIIGGGTYGDAVQGFAGAAYNEVWSSYDGINWTVHTSAPWAARKWHNIAVFDNRMWVLAGGAGDGSGDRNDVWYSADGDHWTELPGTPWVERHAASVFVLNDALYVTGGADVTPVAHIMLNDVWELQIQSM